jgi:hypothetical protein
VGADGKNYTSDQATIWRWRTAFQHDFAARMDWTIRDAKQANHNPTAVVNGQSGKAPLAIEAHVGVPVVLDASVSTDPDGDALTFHWFFYPEAGTGIPTLPVFAGGLSPSAVDSLHPPPLRVVIDDRDRPRATVLPKAAGTAHVILVVEDRGTPTLTSYRRVILHIQSAR